MEDFLIENRIDLTTLKGAIFSEDRKYRYALWRIWSPTKVFRLQIGLNPSKAGAEIDDPTITRGVKRAWLDGFGGFFQGNMYGFVSTNPDVLLGQGDFIGSENDGYLRWMIAHTNQTVCGWGSFPPVIKRAGAVLKMITEPYCLGINRDGQPKHPLYVAYDTPVVLYQTVVEGGGNSSPTR